MQHDHPGNQLHDAPTQHQQGLPSLALPPSPFARSASPDPAPPATPAAAMPADTAAPARPLPTGTDVKELLGALELDGIEPVDARSMLSDFDDVDLDIDLDALLAAPMVGEPGAATPTEPRPHHEFSVDVERRSRRERRRDVRPTPDRRTFTSTNLAAPADGPADPRPTTPPPARDEAARPHRIDPVMPPLPIEPAQPYQLPTRGMSPAAQRSPRAGLATSNPFPTRLDDPPAPLNAPAPPQQQVPMPAPAPGIESIFEASALASLNQPAQPLTTGPAGPAVAPGQDLAPVAAAVAATPSAWFGGNVIVDDAMMVWNAGGTDVPLAAEVAAAIAPSSAAAPVPGPAATAAASGIATTTLAPDVPASTTGSRRSASPLRIALLIGIPAVAGVSIAFAIDHFLL